LVIKHTCVVRAYVRRTPKINWPCEALKKFRVELYAEIYAELCAELRAELRAKLRAELRAELRVELRIELRIELQGGHPLGPLIALRAE